MVESRKEAQQLSRLGLGPDLFQCCVWNRNQHLLSSDQYLHSGNVSRAEQCLSQIRTRWQKKNVAKLWVESVQPLVDQVHPIPYQQSPLTMLLREALSVERMRQTKVVDEYRMQNLYWPLSRSCWWAAFLLVWRTCTAPSRHWGWSSDFPPKEYILHWLLLSGSCPQWRWPTGSRRTWSMTRRTRSTGGRRRSTPGSNFSGLSLVTSLFWPNQALVEFMHWGLNFWSIRLIVFLNTSAPSSEYRGGYSISFQEIYGCEKVTYTWQWQLLKMDLP